MSERVMQAPNSYRRVGIGFAATVLALVATGCSSSSTEAITPPHSPQSFGAAARFVTSFAAKHPKCVSIDKTSVDGLRGVSIDVWERLPNSAADNKRFFKASFAVSNLKAISNPAEVMRDLDSYSVGRETTTAALQQRLIEAPALENDALETKLPTITWLQVDINPDSSDDNIGFIPNDDPTKPPLFGFVEVTAKDGSALPAQILATGDSLIEKLQQDLNAGAQFDCMQSVIG